MTCFIGVFREVIQSLLQQEKNRLPRLPDAACQSLESRWRRPMDIESPMKRWGLHNSNSFGISSCCVH